MGIENHKIIVRVNNFNEEHFKSLGYNVKINDYIEIFVTELPHGSGLKIDVECVYCKKIFKKAYRRYLETKDKLCCKECGSLKMMEGSLEKYGNVCSLRNEKVQEKSKNKNLKNLGVQFPFQNKNILKKCYTNRKNNPKGNLGINISKQQEYIHDLYGGELNYVEFPYRLDIFFKLERIYFEYDGSGHKMGIKFGHCTEEEFDQKEVIRCLFLKEKGYKEFRIISDDDILPSDDVLLDIKAKAFDILLNKNYDSYIYNLNTKTESFKE
jgi:hypothetical protein